MVILSEYWDFCDRLHALKYWYPYSVEILEMEYYKVSIKSNFYEIWIEITDLQLFCLYTSISPFGPYIFLSVATWHFAPCHVGANDFLTRTPNVVHSPKAIGTTLFRPFSKQKIFYQLPNFKFYKKLNIRVR